MATIAHVFMRRILEKKKFNLGRSATFELLRRHVTVVYDNKNFHLPAIPTHMIRKIRKIRKIYETFDVEIPKKLIIKLVAVII
jgi:hypothetical protein